MSNKDYGGINVWAAALFLLLIWAIAMLDSHTDDIEVRLDRIENRLRLLEGAPTDDH